MLATCSPARLKALLGEVQVTERRANSSESEAKGVWRNPGMMSSQWISSATTKTSLRQADLADAPQFLRCPDAPRRVVGIAENHQLHRRIGGRAFQSVEINRVGVSRQVSSHSAAAQPLLATGDEEVVVDGSLHQHLVAGRVSAGGWPRGRESRRSRGVSIRAREPIRASVRTSP